MGKSRYKTVCHGWMTRVDLASVACSIARTVDVLGDAWSWLIVRDLTIGLGRFEDLRKDLGISKQILTDKLANLQQHGIIERTEYQSRPPRHEYSLTDSGRALMPILVSLTQWGDTCMSPDGPPMIFTHHACGRPGLALACPGCGEPVTADDIDLHPGPGGRTGPGTVLIAQALGGTGTVDGS